MADYFYASNGQPTGPVAMEQLDEMVRAGTLAPDTLLWREGMPDWQPYSAVSTGSSAASAGLKVATTLPPPGGVVCSVCGDIFPPDQVIRYGANAVCAGCKPQFLQKLREGANVSGALDYAGFGKRFGAKILDTILVYIVTLGVNFAFGLQAAPAPGQQPNFGLFFGIMAFNLLISFGYPIVFLGKWGQTLGKMAVGVKVVSPAGEPIGFGKATGRVLSEILTGFTIGIGYLMVLWDSERRALHDRLAGTRVVNVHKE
jgi:uncharacterized RDD family membrane protein YckC